MKSFSVYSYIMIILSLYENLNKSIKINFYVNAMSLNTNVNSLPPNIIKISADQNFMNLNSEFNKVKEIQNTQIKNLNLNSNDNFIKKNSNSISNTNNIHLKSDVNIKIQEKTSLKNFNPNQTKNNLQVADNPIISEISHISHMPYKIKLIDTVILIKKNQTDGHIKEKIHFELSPGTFNQIITKISLQSSSEKFSNFRLSS